MGSKKSPPPGSAGYRYYFGLFLGLGRGPVDELVEIRVGGKIALSPHMTTSGSGTIDVPALFGGDKKEGGVRGNFSLMMGDELQAPNPAVAAMIAPTPATGYRGRVTFFFNGMIAAMNPYPKPWSFRVRRAVQGWDGDVFRADLAMIELYGEAQGAEPYTGAVPQNLIRAMNPAHIIFECLTNRPWGRGLPIEAINVESFEIAAQTLFNEGFGMCMSWKRRDDIQVFIQQVIDTIGASLYMDRVTATMTIKLVRKDYEIGDLEVWDTTNGITAITSAKINTASVTINEVIVKYRDPVLNQDRSVNVQNLASLQSNNGAFNTMTKEYKGIPTSSLARRVAQRDLRSKAQGLRRFTIKMDRRGSFINPGDAILIQDEERGILPTVVRVATVKDGTLLKGEIELLAVQDVFSFPATSYIDEQPNTWVPPDTDPCLGEHEVFEAPYFLLAGEMTPADFSFLDDASAFLGVLVEQASRKNVLYDIAVRDSAPEPEDEPTEPMFCGFVPLAAGFTVDPDSGDAPLTVECTDTSVGATSWFYSVVIDGDTVTSEDQNPTFEFPNGGTYEIEQTVYRDGDAPQTATQTVEVSSSEIGVFLDNFDGTAGTYILDHTPDVNSMLCTYNMPNPSSPTNQLDGAGYYGNASVSGTSLSILTPFDTPLNNFRAEASFKMNEEPGYSDPIAGPVLSVRNVTSGAGTMFVTAFVEAIYQDTDEDPVDPPQKARYRMQVSRNDGTTNTTVTALSALNIGAEMSILITSDDETVTAVINGQTLTQSVVGRPAFDQVRFMLASSSTSKIGMMKLEEET